MYGWWTELDLMRHRHRELLREAELHRLARKARSAQGRKPGAGHRVRGGAMRWLSKIRTQRPTSSTVSRQREDPASGCEFSGAMLLGGDGNDEASVVLEVCRVNGGHVIRKVDLRTGASSSAFLPDSPAR